ncbi:phage integrase N-terminal SAM-like domain-containing protein [Thalassolituus oleivorans]|nr:phage integrase N-terminal SAM-like domain-containing protein [Thalassolituus oleivorans]MBQ0781934.1 phage integrase N-terminal SAM-like domain-containing protein [Thalassolituus oleivorans]PCI49118.1 MAG: hypothetical protein COB43_06210 [Oceanospirillales bacterium]PHQ87544.1 MAG: hypothetical protein COB58_04080 [Thalassobium sp.]
MYWIRFYIRFHRLRHPTELSAEHVGMFLSFLSNEPDVSINTQKVALNSLALHLLREGYVSLFYSMMNIS